VASFSDPPVYAAEATPGWLELARRVPAPYALGLAAAVPLVALSVAHFGATGRAAVAAFFVAVLAVLSAVDIAERRLPNRIVLPAAAVVLTAQTVLFPDRALEWTLAAAGAALVLLVAALAHPAGLGMGDVKLALLLGAALGSAVMSAFLVAFFAAALYAVVLLARGGLAARRQTIPLGPFLALGAVTTLFLL
jgi:leader peptidase (prepilin peptidase) / N-methyltransferase